MATTKKFFASTLTEAAGCSPITFRAWRNRNGLFPETQDSSGWNRFSVADITAVTLLARMTAAGLGAQTAVDIVMAALPIIEDACEAKSGENRPVWLIVNIGRESREISVEPVGLDDGRAAIDALVLSYDLGLVLGLGSAMSHVFSHIANNDVPIAAEDGTVEKVLIGRDTKFAAELAAREKVKRELRKQQAKAPKEKVAPKKRAKR